jgi:hypothetical protein
MKKFKNHQRPRRKYIFDIVGHNKALKIWWDSPFKAFLIKKLKMVSKWRRESDAIQDINIRKMPRNDGWE